MVNNYEVLFIVNPTLAEDEIKATVEKFIGLIRENGEIQEVNEWGKRRLAYPIDDIPEGYYVLVYFAADAAFPAELDRRFNIDDAIFRGMTVRRESAKIPDAIAVPEEEKTEEEEIPAAEAPAAAPAEEPAPAAEEKAE
ncbi:MAG: 30S ribosomal protein S6 [Clostridia bacterium]|nr:30S ribosomal protein S6 [Clostridia bacterium]MBQ4297866.1 30S ribosomal protein S6 [Clostridia bacterium]